MKKRLFFSFAMLVSVAASAQSGVTVTPVSATNNTIKFNVSWLNSSRTGTHNSKVWVFVDFREVTNNAPSGSWTRATVSGTPTASSGTPTRETITDKGFWLQGTSGTSGTYNSTVSVTLGNVPAKFNWCAYASDCPPNVTAANGTYTFKGTPPFTLIASNGTTTQTVTEKTLANSALTITPTTIKDKTECPGVFCPYTGNDLLIDNTHACKLRTSGAQNWEAWIQDTRDKEFYRIVLMPDNHWWLAQNVKYANAGSAVTASGCTPDLCGRYYTVTVFRNGGALNTKIQGLCPAGWFAPQWADYNALANAIESNLCEPTLHYPPLVKCAGEKDRYGMAATHAYNRCSGPAGSCGPADSRYYGTNNNANSVWDLSNNCTCGRDYTMAATGYGITWRCYR